MLISTRQAAKTLGITPMTLSRYIAAKKVPEPEKVQLGGIFVHNWKPEDIERVRQLLPKLKNGRKTRYQKQKKQAKKKSKP
jgi:predicted DNA-binding transcriptional regulator AlpA